jgi:hypothetical protein
VNASNERGTRVAIGLALTAAAVRLVPLHWLHPINWDELEFFRAAQWVGQGRVPYRDFWEHHTPLLWFLFAPFSWIAKSPGAAAIITFRWLQVPIWIATFWLLNVFMRNAGLSRFARWTSMALALCSSLLMLSAVEYRIDPLSCALYLAGLVWWQRGTPRALFGTGVMFGLAGLANMRFGPLLAATLLVMLFVRERRWRINAGALWIFAGGVSVGVVALAYFVATNSLRPLLRGIIFDNRIGDQYGPEFPGVFLHRLLIPFGVRVIATDRLFEWAAVDVGGIAITLIGVIALVLALLRWRTPDERFLLALLTVANLVVIAKMRFVYNYHLQIVVLMLLPLIAWMFESVRWRTAVLALLAVSWVVSGFGAIFRGKELDLAYQDFVMRELDARTKPGEVVFGGNPWALHRESAYRFWFLPDMTGRLVLHGYAPPYEPADIVNNPPAAVVFDFYALKWLQTVQPRIAPYFFRHYIPVWRNLGVPAMSAALPPGKATTWIVPRDGTYRLFASPALAHHPWFRQPLAVASYENNDADRITLRLPPPAANPALVWWIDGRPAVFGSSVPLKKGQRVEANYRGYETVGVILLPGDDMVLFQQPPRGATLEAATTRVTHVPQLGVHFGR